mgnify:CR=1 FL=1
MKETKFIAIRYFDYHMECKETFDDRAGKYTPLHQFIINNQIKLTNFIVKRIELNPTWQQEANSFDIELPLVVFENEDGEREAITYSEFLDRQNERSN